MIFDPPSEDTRLVQAAVVGHPNSDNAVSMPMDRGLAQEFKERYRHTTFWCGTMIPGGCGVQLSAKIYRDRVCHFAHHPSPHRCTRVDVGRGSADHLHAKSHLSHWLSVQNRRVRSVGWEADARNDNPYSRVALSLEGTAAPRIYVEFSGHYDTTLEKLVRDTRKQQHTDWLIRDNPRLLLFLLEEDGHAFRLRFRDSRESRLIEVGTQIQERSGDMRLWWHGLDKCVMTESGIVTPALQELRQVKLSSKPPIPKNAKQPEENPRKPLLKKQNEQGSDYRKSLERIVIQSKRARKKGDSIEIRRTTRALSRHIPHLTGDLRNLFREELLAHQKLNQTRRKAESLIRKAESTARRADAKAAKSASKEALNFLQEHHELSMWEARKKVFQINRWAKETLKSSSAQPQKKTAEPSGVPEAGIRVAQPKPQQKKDHKQETATRNNTKLTAAPRDMERRLPTRQNAPGQGTERPADLASLLQDLADHFNSRRS